MAVYLAVTGDVFDGVLCCAVLFFHEMPWMRSGTDLSLFPILFLNTFENNFAKIIIMTGKYVADKNHVVR